MKNLSLSILLIWVNFFLATAQEENVSKEEVFKLYHAAQQAEKNNNSEKAFEIYKTIQSIDSTFLVPNLLEY
jgi:negative regulator of sigma E activity